MTRREEIKQMIRETVAKHLNRNEYRVFIFGSQANSTELKRSDIDIGIETKEPIPESLVFSIKEDLESMRTLYFFDVVDFSKTTDHFIEVAMDNVELL